MSTTLTTSPPWPPVPGAGATDGTRTAWYAAVARWAPSKHNTQPWRFVRQGGRLELWADRARLLPETDPHRRELAVSVGAAAEMACIAVHAAGHEATVALLPDGDDGPAATIEESGPRTPTDDDRELLAAIARRRTDRGPLDGAQLPPGLAFRLQTAASEHGATLHLVSSPGDRSTLADLVQRADRLLLQRGTADRELAPWLRSPVDPRRDGVRTDHTRGGPSSARAEFVQRDFSTETSQPGQDRAGPDRPLVGVLCTPMDSEREWLMAGRALTAVLLRATRAGANASYLNQPLEDPALRSQLRDQLGLEGFPQLVLRLGVGGDVEATPRRSLTELLAPR